MAAEVQLVIFQVGNRVMALALEEVEHILQLGGGREAEGGISVDGGVILFRDEAVPWRPLWEPLAAPSIYREFDELAQTLPQRRQDHIDWMAALEHSLVNDQPFAKARSPYECAFGKWFYAFRSQDRRLALLLSQFEYPHARIHGLADRLLARAEAGERAAALAEFHSEKESTLAQLLSLFDQVLVMLPTLKRPVALILNQGGQRLALGVDRVLDICAVGAEEVRPARGSLGPLSPRGFVARHREEREGERQGQSGPGGRRDQGDAAPANKAHDQGRSHGDGALIPLLGAAQLAALS